MFVRKLVARQAPAIYKELALVFPLDTKSFAVLRRLFVFKLTASAYCQLKAKNEG